MTTETSQFVSAECVHLADLASNRTATIRTQSEDHVRPATEAWERGVSTPPRPICSIGHAGSWSYLMTASLNVQPAKMG